MQWIPVRFTLFHISIEESLNICRGVLSFVLQEFRSSCYDKVVADVEPWHIKLIIEIINLPDTGNVLIWFFTTVETSADIHGDLYVRHYRETASGYLIGKSILNCANDGWASPFMALMCKPNFNPHNVGMYGCTYVEHIMRNVLRNAVHLTKSYDSVEYYKIIDNWYKKSSQALLDCFCTLQSHSKMSLSKCTVAVVQHPRSQFEGIAYLDARFVSKLVYDDSFDIHNLLCHPPIRSRFAQFWLNYVPPLMFFVIDELILSFCQIFNQNTVWYCAALIVYTHARISWHISPNTPIWHYNGDSFIISKKETTVNHVFGVI